MATETRKVKKPLNPAEQLRQQDAKYLLCKSLCHAWGFAGDGMFHVHERYNRKITQVSRELECARCTSTRKDIYEYPSFVKMKAPAYRRPRGYQIDGAAGRNWRQDANNELFRRQEVK